MAKVIMLMPEDFLRRLSALGEKSDEITGKVLQAGGAAVLAKVKNNMTAVVGRDTKMRSRSTGELAGALGLSAPRLDRDGNFNIKVGFAEPRAGGASNAMLANILEYGKHGQPAKPFLKLAVRAAKSAAQAAMKEAFEEEVNRL